MGHIFYSFAITEITTEDKWSYEESRLSNT